MPLSEENRKLLGRKVKEVVPTKTPTKFEGSNEDRAKRVLEIWNSIPKPERKFKNAAEQAAYQLGVADERYCQSQYDNKLRDEGLR
jgi:hypothetical protein